MPHVVAGLLCVCVSADLCNLPGVRIFFCGDGKIGNPYRYPASQYPAEIYYQKGGTAIKRPS